MNNNFNNGYPPQGGYPQQQQGGYQNQGQGGYQWQPGQPKHIAKTFRPVKDPAKAQQGYRMATIDLDEIPQEYIKYNQKGHRTVRVLISPRQGRSDYGDDFSMMAMAPSAPPQGGQNNYGGQQNYPQQAPQQNYQQPVQQQNFQQQAPPPQQAPMQGNSMPDLPF